jgi:hypothetical protein
MVGYFTLPEIAQAPCPIGRTFVEARRTCATTACPLFREAPLTCNAAWLDAVRRAAIEVDDKTPAKAKAAAEVLREPEKWGVERRYYCGLGGRA